MIQYVNFKKVILSLGKTFSILNGHVYEFGANLFIQNSIHYVGTCIEPKNLEG